MLTEHTHIPVAAGMVGARRRAARRVLPAHPRPVRGAGFAAAATEKLVVGTSVCLVIEHDPIVLAKQIASLQNLSRRALRVRRSARAGTSRRCSTTAPTPRRATATCASGRGDAGHLDAPTRPNTTASTWTSTRSGSGPSPIPLPPVLIGGNGPRVEDRVLRYGDGWMPNMKDLDDAQAAHRRAARARRAPRSRDLLRRHAREPRALQRRGRGPRADRPRVRPRALDTLIDVSEEPVLRIHQTRSRSNPGGMDVTKVLGEDVLPFRTPQARLVQGPAPRQPEVPRAVEDDRRRGPAHGLQGSGLPEHRRLLGPRHGHVHDPRRHLHAPLRLLQRQDRQADLERPAGAAARGPQRRPDGPAPRRDHVASTATTCPTTARRSGAA